VSTPIVTRSQPARAAVLALEVTTIDHAGTVEVGVFPYFVEGEDGIEIEAPAQFDQADFINPDVYASVAVRPVMLSTRYTR